MEKLWADKGANKVAANHNLKWEEVQIPPESPLRRENLLLKQNSNKTSSSSTSGEKGESLDTNLLSHLHITNTTDFITCSIQLHQQPVVTKTSCLLDNGALGGANFISNALATILKRAGTVVKVVSKDVATAIDFLYIISKETVMCNIKLIPEVRIKNPLIIPIEAYIIPSKIDLILGRNTIKDFNLATLFPSQFFHMNLTARKQPREIVKLSDAAVAPGPRHRQGTILTAIHLRELREQTFVPESIDYELHAPAFEVHDSIINKNELNTSSDIIDLITIETDKELKLYQVKDL